MPIMALLGALYVNEETLIFYLSWIMIINAVVTVFLLQYMNLKAPYGRYSSSAWGFAINAKVAWVIQELPSLMVPLYYWCMTEAQQAQNLPNKILLSVFFIHYIQRSLVFPLLIKGGKPTPSIPFFLAFFFTLYNGYLQGRSLTQYIQYGPGRVEEPTFIIGLGLFFLGMAVNIHSDHILRNLRKPGETGYKIPKGGMFEYVSGANFFGEVIEWTGFAIACNSLPAAAFATFTWLNIGPRALHHHRWYKEKFEDYPSNRKALIPFLL